MQRLIHFRACLMLFTFSIAVPLFAQTQSSSPVAPTGSPCSAKPEHKQFDFWVGEWDVMDKDQKVATSSIQHIVGDCIIFENYFQVDGYTGKSFNYFDATLGKWRQTWVDSAGNMSEFIGEFKENAMRLEGESHRQNGQKVLRRMILSTVGTDRVRQYSERSIDGGKTWKIAYDFLYIRHK